MKPLSELIKEPKEKKKVSSERAFWVEKCAELTGMTFKVMLWKTIHCPTWLIHDMYDDAQGGTGQVGKAKKFWWLLGKTRVKK